MTKRLILFCLFLIGVVVVLNFKAHKDVGLSNQRFDFEKTKSQYFEKQQIIAKKTLPENEKLETPPTQKLIPLVELSSEELKRGHALYKKCIACHGKAGEGKKSQKGPALGGQFDWYIEEQIVLIQKGKRINKVMLPYVKRLSSQDVKDLAAYISKLPWVK